MICLFSQFLFNIILDNLARAISQENKLKGIHIEKEDVKLYAFTDNIVLHIENPKVSINNNNKKISARLWNFRKSI